MTPFDLPTAYVIMGMLYLFMPMAIWYALRGAKARSVMEWCSGGLMFGAGLYLIGQRGHWPDWLTYEISVLLLNAAQLIRVAAISKEAQSPVKYRLLMGVLSVYALAYTAMRNASDAALQLHYPLSLLFMAFYFAWIALLALKIARQEGLVSGWWLTIAYAPLSIMLFLQIYRFFSVDGFLHPLLNDWASIALVLCGNLTAVVGNIAFMGVFVERTLRKEVESAAERARAAEGQRLERHIAQLDRVRSMGMMSASLAHELSQPLSSLQLVAGQAQMELSSGAYSPSKMSLHLSRILEYSAHTSDVVQRIRSFVRSESAVREPVDLIQVHETVRSLLSHGMRNQGVPLILLPHAPIPALTGDRVQLTQVLLNVYRNALEAIGQKQGGRVEVQFNRQHNHVEITIVDNGPGLPAQALAHISDGFFTTKSGGLGMGLLISRQIVAAHGGELRVDNRPQGGACVRIVLPCSSV